MVRLSGIPHLALWVLTVWLASAVPLSAQTCVVVDNGTGTIDLPPAGCGYVGPGELHMMIDGLPPGTTINVAVEHRQFTNVVTMPGGSLGGEIEIFDSFLSLTLTGTGSLAGYSRNLLMQANCEVHTGPRTLGDGVQSFATEMVRIEGQLVGDPDFDLLRITAGNQFGLPSPGHTTLTRSGGNFNVDSFFDIAYQIEFTGAPGSVFNGLSGVSPGAIPMVASSAAGPPPPCTVVDMGGTVFLPPAGCGYVSPSDLHMMIAGLPAGTMITVAVEHRQFNTFGPPTPGGPLGGFIEEFGSIAILSLHGTGALAGYSREIPMTLNCTTATGPRLLGDPVQFFPNEMLQMQGQIVGDPDFDLLRITAGTGFGLPSPGHTTLTRLGPPGSPWAVDSFFDITYQIEFVGAPGGPVAGMNGLTTGSVQMSTSTAGGPPPEPQFVRGNCNGLDGNVDIADAIFLLGHLFPGSGGSTLLPCRDACDANNDGVIDIADAIALLSSLFGSPTVPLPPPSASTGCGPDPASPPDTLDCLTAPPGC